MPQCWKTNAPTFPPIVAATRSNATYAADPSADLTVMSSAVLLPSTSPLNVRVMWIRASALPSNSPSSRSSYVVLTKIAATRGIGDRC